MNGEYGIGWTTRGDKFLFDLDDYNNIKKYCWNTKDGNGDYKRVVTNTEYSKTVPLHFIITGKHNIDHKNRDTFDNRKSNFRECTYQQNSSNRSKQSNNTSGIIGVIWRKDNKKWEARININKKQVKLGCFHVFEDAVVARLKAEKKYYGEFAPQKHLYEQYGIV